MSLYVKRYINHGKVMYSEKINGKYDNFYYSFYELNNDRIIELQLIETVTKDEVKRSELIFNGTSYILKNRKEINYYLGQDFLEWFNLSPPFFEIKSSTIPSHKEITCVERFFYKYVNKVRNQKTNIIHMISS